MAFRMEFPLNRFAQGTVRFHRDGELCEAGDDRFILANVELPVAGSDDTFVWTCWISLSNASYERMRAEWDSPEREKQDEAFGYLSNHLPTYEPATFALKTLVHTRRVGLRPWVQLEPTEHPLAVEQRNGITYERIAAIYHAFAAQETMREVDSGSALAPDE
jgi:hypothetical protein